MMVVMVCFCGGGGDDGSDGLFLWWRGKLPFWDPLMECLNF